MKVLENEEEIEKEMREGQKGMLKETRKGIQKGIQKETQKETQEENITRGEKLDNGEPKEEIGKKNVEQNSSPVSSSAAALSEEIARAGKSKIAEDGYVTWTKNAVLSMMAYFDLHRKALQNAKKEENWDVLWQYFENTDLAPSLKEKNERKSGGMVDKKFSKDFIKELRVAVFKEVSETEEAISFMDTVLKENQRANDFSFGGPERRKHSFIEEAQKFPSTDDLFPMCRKMKYNMEIFVHHRDEKSSFHDLVVDLVLRTGPLSRQLYEKIEKDLSQSKHSTVPDDDDDDTSETVSCSASIVKNAEEGDCQRNKENVCIPDFLSLAPGRSLEHIALYGDMENPLNYGSLKEEEEEEEEEEGEGEEKEGEKEEGKEKEKEEKEKEKEKEDQEGEEREKEEDQEGVKQTHHREQVPHSILLPENDENSSKNDHLNTQSNFDSGNNTILIADIILHSVLEFVYLGISERTARDIFHSFNRALCLLPQKHMNLCAVLLQSIVRKIIMSPFLPSDPQKKSTNKRRRPPGGPFQAIAQGFGIQRCFEVMVQHRYGPNFIVPFDRMSLEQSTVLLKILKEVQSD